MHTPTKNEALEALAEQKSRYEQCKDEIDVVMDAIQAFAATMGISLTHADFQIVDVDAVKKYAEEHPVQVN